MSFFICGPANTSRQRDFSNSAWLLAAALAFMYDSYVKVTTAVWQCEQTFGFPGTMWYPCPHMSPRTARWTQQQQQQQLPDVESAARRGGCNTHALPLSLTHCRSLFNSFPAEIVEITFSFSPGGATRERRADLFPAQRFPTLTPPSRYFLHVHLSRMKNWWWVERKVLKFYAGAFSQSKLSSTLVCLDLFRFVRVDWNFTFAFHLSLRRDLLLF